MTLGEIIRAVQRQFGDTSEAELKREDIVRYANEGQVDIVRLTDCLQDTETFVMVVGTASYNLPADFLEERWVTYDGSPLAKTTPELINLTNPNRTESSSQGIPSQFYLWGSKLYLYPVPSEVNDVEMFYVKSPAVLVNDGDIPEIPLAFHPDLVRHCLGRAKELDEEDAKSREIFSDLNNRLSESQFEAQWPHTDSYPSVRLLPGDW